MADTAVSTAVIGRTPDQPIGTAEAIRGATTLTAVMVSTTTIHDDRIMTTMGRCWCRMETTWITFQVTMTFTRLVMEATTDMADTDRSVGDVFNGSFQSVNPVATAWELAPVS